MHNTVRVCIFQTNETISFQLVIVSDGDETLSFVYFENGTYANMGDLQYSGVIDKGELSHPTWDPQAAAKPYQHTYFNGIINSTCSDIAYNDHCTKFGMFLKFIKFHQLPKFT